MEVSQTAPNHWSGLCVASPSRNTQHRWKKHVLQSSTVIWGKEGFPSHSSDSAHRLYAPIMRDIKISPKRGALRLQTAFLHSRKITHVSDKGELLSAKEGVWFISVKHIKLTPSSQPSPGLLWARAELKPQAAASWLLFDPSWPVAVS